MDPQKKILILHWVSNVWGKKTETFLELKDGRFFQHVLNLLEHKTEGDESSPTNQFCEVQKYLEDHYGKEARINEILKFDQLIGGHASQQNDLDLEMELAKIAVFLLSLALFSTKGNQIVATASLDLPVQMHGDIKNLVQSVVETQCTDSVCSSTIEDVLRSPSGAEKSFDENSIKAFFEKPLCYSLTPKEQQLLREMSPIEAFVNDGPTSIKDNHPKNPADSQSSISENLFASRDGASSPPLRNEFSPEPPMKSTPKYSKGSTVNVSKMLPTESPLPLNASTYNVSFGISSPFRALNISASSSVSPLANFIQSPEIIQKLLLKKKELELSKMKRELNNQVYLCEDLQITIQDNIKTITTKDAEVEKLKMRIKELLCLQDAKDELEEIKPKLSDLGATVEKLNGKLFKLEYYKSQCQILEKENSEQREEIQQLHEEVKSLEVDTSEKKDLLLVKSQMKIQIETLEAQVSELTKGKTELEDKCNILQGKLVHANQQYEQLQGEFNELIGTKNDSVQGESMGVVVDVQLGELKVQVEELTQIRSDLMEELQEVKASQSKLEAERSKVVEQKACHEALMSEQMKAMDDVKAKCGKYEEQILSLNTELREAKVTILSEQEKNTEIMSQITSQEEEIMSAKKVEENLLEEIDNLKKEINFLNKERKILSENVEEKGNKLSEYKKILGEKDKELSDINTTLEELKNVVGQKNEEIHTLVMNMALKESVKEEMTMKMNLCEREICNLKKCISEKEEEMEGLKLKQNETVSTLDEKLRLIVEEKESIIQSLDYKGAQMEEMSEKLRSRESDFTSLQKQYDKVNIALSEMQDCVKGIEENLLVTKQQLEIKNAEYTVLKEELLQKTSDHEQMTKENEEQCSVITDLQFKLESLEEIKHSLFHQMDEKSQEVESMRKLVVEKEEEHIKELKAMREETSLLQSQLEQKSHEANQQLEDKNAEYTLLKEELSQKNSDHEQMTKEIEEQCTIITNLQSKLESLEEKEHSLSHQVDEKSQEVESMRKLVVGKQEEHIEELKAMREETVMLQSQLEQISHEAKQQLEDKNAEYTLLKEELSQKNNDYEQMTKENEEQCTIITNLQSKLESLEEKEHSLSHQVDEKSQEVESMRKLVIEKQEEHIKELKATREETSLLQSQLEQISHEAKQQLEDKNAESTLLKEELSQKNNDYEQMTKENEEQCTIITNLQSKLESLEEKEHSLSHQVDEKSQEVESMRKLVVEKQEEHIEELKAMKEETSLLQSQFEQKSQEAEELLSEKDKAMSEIKTLESRLVDAEIEMSSVRSDLQSKTEILFVLEEKKEKAAEEIASLHTQVNFLMNKEKDLSDDHSQTVCQLRSDLERMTFSVSSLKQQLEDNLKDHDQQLKVKNADTENCKVQIKDLEDQVTVLKAKIEEYKVDIVSQKNENNKLYSVTEENLHIKEKEKLELTELVTLKNEEVETFKCRFQEKEAACSVAQEKISHLGTAVIELEDKVKLLEENCSSLTQQLTGKEGETSNLMEAIEEKERELQQYAHSTSELEKYITQLREELNLIEKERTDLKSKLENTLSEVSFFQKALHESDSRNKELEMKLESSFSEQKILLERYEDKLNELNHLKIDTENSKENHESQLLAFKGEISLLKSDIQEKEEEVEKLHQECENKSHQLTERQVEVTNLLASISNDQNITEAKLLDYSHQVSNVVTQIREKEEEMLAKDTEIGHLNLKIDQQDKLIEDLTSSIEQIKQSLSEMKCLKESSEISRDEMKNKLEDKENEISKLCTDMRSSEERRLELVHKLEEEVSHLQQQAAIIEDKDNLICQLEKELAMMKDVKKQLNVKEQELSLLSEECHTIKERHKDELYLLCKESKSVISTILHYLIESLDSGKENQEEVLQLKNIAEDTLSLIHAAVEELRQKFKAKKTDLENEVVKMQEETESSWRLRIDELEVEKEEERKLERANHELQIVKARQEVELNWSEKWNDYQLRVTEERNAEAAKFEREIVQLRESLAAEWEEKCDMQTKYANDLKEEFEKLEDKHLSLAAEWEEKCDMQTKHANDLKEKVEKLEKDKQLIQEKLNRKWQDALDDLQLKFEAAKASEMKALSQQKAELLELKETYETKLTMQRMETDKVLKSVHDENTKLLERETVHLKNTETQMKTANDYCNSLKKQLEGATGKLTALEQEILNLKESYGKQNDQLAKMRETNESLNCALSIERDTNAKLQQRVENHISKLNNSKLLTEKTQQENKNYAVEVNKLKTSLDYSERKLQEYKHQLDQAGTALLGDSSHFHQMIQEHDNTLDDSLMGKEAHTPRYNLRSSIETRQSFIDTPNETIISGDRVMLKRETLASSSDIKRNASPRSRLSISSTTSSLSNKSVNGLPPGVRPNMQSCANEPEEFEWDRLSELQRRNTLCLPHMKSSYPVEIQNVKKEKFSDDSLRLSVMPRRKATPDRKGVSESGKLGKRKSPTALKQTDITSPKLKKPEVSPGGTVMYFPLAKDGPIYPPLRPPTPGKQRKYGKASMSSPLPGTRHKVLGSTVARRKQHTPSPRKSSRLNPKSPRVVNIEEYENKLQESIAFNIGFTPDKSGGRKRMLKKKEASSTITAPIKSLTNIKQMMKEVSRQTDISDENLDGVRTQGNCDMTHTTPFLRKSLEKNWHKSFSSPSTSKEVNVNRMEHNMNKDQVMEDGLIKMNLGPQSNFCDVSKALNFSEEVKFGNNKQEIHLGRLKMNVKPKSSDLSNTIRPSDLMEADDVFVDTVLNHVETFLQPKDPDMEQEAVIFRNTLNGRSRKKSVTFSSDVCEKESDPYRKTPERGKNVTKPKGKVAKLVSLFTSHPTQKRNGKEIKKIDKKAKYKVSPRRSFRLQSPLVYNTLSHKTSPYVNIIGPKTSLALPAEGAIHTQSVFPSPSLMMVNDCSTPVTSKGKRSRKKLFTPNRVNPSTENLAIADL